MVLGKKEKGGVMGRVVDDKPGESPAEPKASGKTKEAAAGERPNPAQQRYLLRGLNQPGGKLPLFDEDGKHVHPALVKACVAHGWAEPWFDNPLKPDWLVCKLTEKGRQAVS